MRQQRNEQRRRPAETEIETDDNQIYVLHYKDERDGRFKPVADQLYCRGDDFGFLLFLRAVAFSVLFAIVVRMFYFCVFQNLGSAAVLHSFKYFYERIPRFLYVYLCGSVCVYFMFVCICTCIENEDDGLSPLC